MKPRVIIASMLLIAALVAAKFAFDRGQAWLAKVNAEARAVSIADRVSRLALTATMTGNPASAVIDRAEYFKGASIPLLGVDAVATLTEIAEGAIVVRVEGRDFRVGIRSQMIAAPVTPREDPTDRRDRLMEEERKRQAEISDRNMARIQKEEDEAKARYEQAKRRAALPPPDGSRSR